MDEKTILVTRSAMPSFEEYCDEIKEIWDSRWLSNYGVKYQKLQNELKELFSVHGVELFCNGHMALELAINAFSLKGEVITTPFTFSSTTQAIMRNGLTPVFCDVDKDTCCIDPDKIEELITEKTCAIVPVHVYGNVCDYKAINDIAKKHNLKVIYDAAHAFGEMVDGVSVASLGDASMFSFHATKVFHTIEGGCISYSDIAIGQKLTALQSFGMIGKDDAEYIGANAKMNEFQAAMGICNLKHINEYISARKKCANRYREKFSDIDGITLCPVQENVKSNYAYFPVFFDKDKFGLSRDEVADNLAAHNIFPRKYFYPLTSDFSAVRNYCSVNKTPIARSIADAVLTLPLYADLTVEDVDRICDIILNTASK